MLADHIQAAKNALYSSRLIRRFCFWEANPIVREVKNAVFSMLAIRRKIFKDVKKAEFFAMIANKTSDTSRTEQFPLRVRDIRLDTWCIQEDLLCYVAVEDVSERKGHNNATVMSGALCAIQMIIQSYRLRCTSTAHQTPS